MHQQLCAVLPAKEAQHGAASLAFSASLLTVSMPCSLTPVASSAFTWCPGAYNSGPCHVVHIALMLSVAGLTARASQYAVLP